MGFDYSKLNDADLEALSKEDYSSMSDEGLQHISSYEEPKQAAPEQPYESNWERAGKEVGTAAIGAGQVATDLYSQNPVVGTALASTPLTVPAGMKIADKISGVVNASTAANNANALGVLEHQVRQYAKAGQPVPAQLQTALEAIRGKVAGPITPQAVTPGPTAVPGAVAPGATSMASRVLGGISKLAAPAAIASELMYTSPEDRAALQQMESSGTSLSDYANQKLGVNFFGQNKKKKDTYSNLTSHEQEVLHKDHSNRADRLKNMIQEAAAKKALVDPTMAR